MVGIHRTAGRRSACPQKASHESSRRSHTPQTKATQQSSRLRRPETKRELYLMDAESWAVITTRGELQAGVGDLFREIFHPTTNDAVIVGVDGRRVFPAYTEFPGCLMRIGSGPSGGERALIDALDVAHEAATYSGITICSGDGEFAPLARKYWELGLRVRISSWRSRLATDLVRAEYEVVFLDHFIASPAAIPSFSRSLRVRRLGADQCVVAA